MDRTGRLGADRLGLGRNAEKVVFVRILDANGDDVAGLESARIAQVDFPVDFGCVGL